MNECLELYLLGPKPLPIWHTKLPGSEEELKLKTAFHCELSASGTGLESKGMAFETRASFMS